MPRSVGTSTVSVTVDRRPTPSRSEQRRHRVAPDEREPAPALAVLDRLEQEPRPVADELGERRHRRLEVGEQLGPHRHDGVPGGERVELVAARADLTLSRSEAAEEARAGAGVAGAVAVLVDLEQQRVAVAVVVRLADGLVVAAGVALAPQLLAAAAPVDHAPLGERALQRLGVHPGHHQHVAGVGVLGDGRHQPVGVERDTPEHRASRRPFTGTAPSTPRCARRRRRGGRARAA